ncbi:MAG: amidohydrolase [Planctomycetes bacterium]|nr:amidohydrolase [Planctomycetota bacterium]
MPTPERLRALIAEELPSLIALRRDLHAHPETAFEERRTSEVVQRELAAAGIEHRGGLARGTGVLAHIAAEGGRATALRADMDALPITEATGAAWSSTTPGRMHACGHDGHTTILIGAARVLSALAQEGRLPHPITLLFQPAEESSGGGRCMIEDGALDGSVLGPPVERIMGLHCWPWLETGAVALRAGPVMASADEIRIAVHGVGSHAALPHTGRDPVLAASAIVVALQQIVSRTLDPLDAAVVGISSVHGGTAGNVIPERVDLLGTMRTLCESTRTAVKERIERVATNTALAHGCTATVAFRDGYPVTVNDKALTEIAGRQLARAVGTANTRTMPAPVMGAEDFSYYGQRVPACYIVLGTGREGAPVHPLHSPHFDFNDEAIATGVMAMCAMALAPTH